MAKYVKAFGGNGYCGCDWEDVFIYPDDVTEEEINEDVYSRAVDEGESYSYVHFGWDSDYSEEDYDEYMENYIHCGWDWTDRDGYLAHCDNYSFTPKTEEEVKRWVGEM